ncbi:MAG: hypothetical protein B6I20_10240 [Bacteroidetes bacterium 4572_117]|nr:MAG: hypothetical protein B6I20_10240 [Bacteroidetes bacterium 4572_117]
MDNLSWFTKWYSNQICKNTGLPLDINISTCEKAAWNISIDLTHTKYSKLVFKKLTKIKSEYNWYSIEIKNKEFVAEGDFTKLEYLIGKFREVIGESTSNLSIKDDFFLNTHIQEFIFEDEEDTIIFLHYTDKRKIADKIIETGLEFTYAFDKTATKAKNNQVDLSYNHYIRKQFGDNVLVICISKKIYNFYLDKISDMGSPILRVEEILSEKPVYENEDAEDVFTLHHKFIKGYFNYKSGEIVNNINYNPDYDSHEFLANIKAK